MDLFEVLDAKKRIEAGDWLSELNVKMMSQTTSVEDFRKFVSDLRREAGLNVVSKPKFDEAGFEALKMQLKMGL